MYDDRSADAMEPLCFAILKSLTPDEHDIRFYDERLEPVPFDEQTDLLALTVETYTARRAYQIADRYRQRGVPVAMGGYHPTFLPEETLQHADAIVKGDAEGAWERLLRDFEMGSLQPVYESETFPELAGQMPDRSIFEGKKYAPMGLVQFSRGCRFNCSFCSIRAFYGNSLRQRPVDEVVEDIRRSGKRHIFIVDDNLFVDNDKARALFEALVPLNITWSCQVSIDIAREPELVRLMARSGCISALIGFESLDPASLREIRKGWNVKWQSYDEAINVFRRAGIMLYGSSPLAADHPAGEPLRPVMRLESELIAVHQLSPGDAIGYGARFTCREPTRVGVVAMGYADGYPRHAPDGTPVAVNDKMTRLIGRVSMDMLTVDLNDQPDARIGDRPIQAIGRCRAS